MNLETLPTQGISNCFPNTFVVFHHEETTCGDSRRQGCHVQKEWLKLIVISSNSLSGRTPASLKGSNHEHNDPLRRNSEEFVEVVKVNRFEVARFNLLHQALELRKQSSTSQQREQQCHQQGSA